jgi:hypothetical protein
LDPLLLEKLLFLFELLVEDAYLRRHGDMINFDSCLYGFQCKGFLIEVLEEVT